MFKLAAVAMVGLVAAIIANTNLDRAPATEVRAYVLAKNHHSGKGGDDYVLVVWPSWRAGRDRESVEVGRDIFSRAKVGNTVSVDLHPGLFHLPWYNNVSLK